MVLWTSKKEFRCYCYCECLLPNLHYLKASSELVQYQQHVWYAAAQSAQEWNEKRENWRIARKAGQITWNALTHKITVEKKKAARFCRIRTKTTVVKWAIFYRQSLSISFQVLHEAWIFHIAYFNCSLFLVNIWSKEKEIRHRHSTAIIDHTHTHLCAQCFVPKSPIWFEISTVVCLWFAPIFPSHTSVNLSPICPYWQTCLLNDHHNNFIDSWAAKRLCLTQFRVKDCNVQSKSRPFLELFCLEKTRTNTWVGLINFNYSNDRIVL